MKIWLKSPDPNHQCCGCNGKTGPCGACCSGILEGDISMLKNVYDGKEYVPTEFAARFGCDIPATFFQSINAPTGFNISAFLNGQTRNGGQIYVNNSNNNFQILDGVQNIVVQPGRGIYNGKNETTQFFNYKIQSSNDQLKFISELFPIDFIGNVDCDQVTDIQLAYAYIQEIQATFNSGDTLSFNIQGNVQRTYIDNFISLGGSNILFNKGYVQPALDIFFFLRKSSTGHQKWLSYNGIDQNGQTITIHNTFGQQNNNIVETPGQNHDAFAYCVDNYFPPIQGGSTCRPSNNQIPGQIQSCISFFAPPDSPSAPPIVAQCCPDKITLPITIGINGQFSVRFLSAECVNIQTQDFPGFASLDISIITANGASINPLSRFVKISVDTGTFLACHSSPP